MKQAAAEELQELKWSFVANPGRSLGDSFSNPSTLSFLSFVGGGNEWEKGRGQDDVGQDAFLESADDRYSPASSPNFFFFSLSVVFASLFVVASPSPRTDGGCAMPSL